jgi:hypothetical protein
MTLRNDLFYHERNIEWQMCALLIDMLFKGLLCWLEFIAKFSRLNPAIIGFSRDTINRS